MRDGPYNCCFGATHYLPGVGQVLDGVGCCKLLGNNLLEVL